MARNFYLRKDGALYDEEGNGPCFGVWFKSVEQAQEYINDAEGDNGTVYADCPTCRKSIEFLGHRCDKHRPLDVREACISIDDVE